MGCQASIEQKSLSVSIKSPFSTFKEEQEDQIYGNQQTDAGNMNQQVYFESFKAIQPESQDDIQQLCQDIEIFEQHKYLEQLIQQQMEYLTKRRPKCGYSQNNQQLSPIQRVRRQKRAKTPSNSRNTSSNGLSPVSILKNKRKIKSDISLELTPKKVRFQLDDKKRKNKSTQRKNKFTYSQLDILY